MRRGARTARRVDRWRPSPGRANEGRARLPRQAWESGARIRASPDHRARYRRRSSPGNPGDPDPTRANRVGLSCERGHAPGQLLQALHELGSVVDDRLRVDLGERYERHSAGSAGADKPTVTFEVCAATPADALQSAGIAAVDLSGVALVVRAQ